MRRGGVSVTQKQGVASRVAFMREGIPVFRLASGNIEDLPLDERQQKNIAEHKNRKEKQLGAAMRLFITGEDQEPVPDTNWWEMWMPDEVATAKMAGYPFIYQGDVMFTFEERRHQDVFGWHGDLVATLQNSTCVYLDFTPQAQMEFCMGLFPDGRVKHWDISGGNFDFNLNRYRTRVPQIWQWCDDPNVLEFDKGLHFAISAAQPPPYGMWLPAFEWREGEPV
jgi:hypothetical protein